MVLTAAAKSATETGQTVSFVGQSECRLSAAMIAEVTHRGFFVRVNRYLLSLITPPYLFISRKKRFVYLVFSCRRFFF